MSVSSLESRERQQSRELERCNKELNSLVKKESDALKKVQQLNSRLKSSKAASQIKTYNRQIAAENKRISDSKKKQVNIQKKISDITNKLNTTRIALGKARNVESKKALELMQHESEARIKEIVLKTEKTFERSDSSDKNYEHDIFFSYAHEDSDYADSLVKKMKDNGVDVVFDKNDLAWGESIIDFIDNHLKQVKYGIILLTPTYLEKYWATYELKSLLQRHSRSNGKNIILPIWHNITADEIASRSLALTDFNALPTSIYTQDDIVEKVMDLLPNNNK